MKPILDQQTEIASLEHKYKQLEEKETSRWISLNKTPEEKNQRDCSRHENRPTNKCEKRCIGTCHQELGNRNGSQ